MEAKQKLETLLSELEKVNSLPRLSSAVQDVDQVIQLLSEAREQIAGAMDPHTASMTMTRLQNPIKFAFGKVNDDLKAASSAHKKLGRSLDKHFPLKELPTDNACMDDHLPLINRAIAMHLLREGQFSVAATFINEVQTKNPAAPAAAVTSGPTYDEPMDEDEDEDEDEDDYNVDEEDDENEDHIEADPPPANQNNEDDEYDLNSLHSQELQDKFAEMYNILQQLKAHNLLPAIEWARSNSAELEARGSNLEFELSKLQYVWLFMGPGVDGLPNDAQSGRFGALAYARQNFGRFRTRHLREIQELASAMVFAPNLAESPYHLTFSAVSATFADVAASFTREFCSLLGLSAESPLYLAVTAGALALPRLMKYMLATRSKGTEWTTTSELPFETPLPESMLFHSIFVCPVSKEQTTEDNPPMVIPCGHMLARETLQKLCKGNRFKCPYCPSEGLMKDARRVVL
ncbi:CTLH/CRA C-terminal to lish motif domain-containing protein [Dichotomopilus funicola]|uniref:GID complex catalytic subunit 2 n=1 Tax=Dichotomopilus funicola TaxID=1934379 RepID=A0AAN6ZPQ8_9PEZI|nr:CTLH/CRA C-terminal to lish motif domain-containing protein [Dichotomopilus funicola]